jgi:hypothetical protein
MEQTRFNFDDIEELTKHHQFMFVPDFVVMNITDVNRLWTQNPNIIVLVTHRLVGLADEISLALETIGYSDEEIQDVLDTALTSNNYDGEYADVYMTQLEGYNEWMKSVNKTIENSEGLKLLDFMIEVNPAVKQKKSVVQQYATKEPVKDTKKRKRPEKWHGFGKGTFLQPGLMTPEPDTKPIYRKPGRVKPLETRINELPEGKVLDVSNMQPNGTGAITIAPKRNRFGSPTLPIVSADYDHYALAISMLPGGADAYSEDLKYMREVFGISENELDDFEEEPQAVRPAPIIPKVSDTVSKTIKKPVSPKVSDKVPTKKPASPKVSDKVPTKKPASPKVSGKVSLKPASPKVSGKVSLKSASPKISGKVSLKPASPKVSGKVSTKKPASRSKVTKTTEERETEDLQLTTSTIGSAPKVTIRPRSSAKQIRQPTSVTKEVPAITATESDDIDISDKVDIFDFDTYQEEFDLLSDYFGGLELYLRTALLIDYKYNHLAPENRQVFDDALNKHKTYDNKKEFLENILDAFEPREMLAQWYRHFIPDKLREDPDVINRVAEKYQDKIDIAFNRMYKKRVDPDWELSPLWFSPNPAWYETHKK